KCSPLPPVARGRFAPRFAGPHVLCISRAGRGAIAARGEALYGVRVGLAAPERIGPVAQWLEPTAHNGLVGGSNPPGPTMFWTRRGARRSVSGTPPHEQNQSLLAPSLGQERLHLRGHPHDALQRAARVRHVERG